MSNQTPQGAAPQKSDAKPDQKPAKKVFRVHPHGALEHNGARHEPGARAPEMSEEDRDKLVARGVLVPGLD